MTTGTPQATRLAETRDSGIPVLGPIPWSSHFVQFYDTTQDLLDVVVPYFAAGLAAGEACMWVTADPLTPEAAAEALAALVPDLDELRIAGALTILPHTEWYVQDEVFDAERVLRSWKERLDATRALGFPGLRVSGDTFWLRSEQWEDFAAYEAAIDGAIEGLPFLVLCTYSLGRCGGRQVLDVVRTHQYALVKDEGRWVQIESTQRKVAVAEIERLNADLRHRSQELGAANEELRSFAHSVSHDLRAPLRAIDGFSRALAEDAGDRLDATCAAHLERIRGAVGRMEILLDGLLHLAATMQAPLHPQPLDLTTMARALVADLRHLDPAREVEVVLPESLPAEGDAALVHELLRHLLDNAWKATATQPAARIELGAIDVDGERVFVVRDNGIGFDPAFAEHAFLPFQSAHPDANATGGVGLATVARIAMRHGGRVRAESVEGAGATFSFTLGPPDRG